MLKRKNAASEGKTPEGKVKVETVGAGSSAVATGPHKSSPATKSKAAEIEVKKQNVKGKNESAGETVAGGKQKPSLTAKSKTPAIEVKKQDAKGKAPAATAGETVAAGKQKPSPAAKSKTPAVEVKKQDAKGKAQAAEGRVPRS